MLGRVVFPCLGLFPISHRWSVTEESFPYRGGEDAGQVDVCLAPGRTNAGSLPLACSQRPQQRCYGLGSHLWDWPFIKNQDFFQVIIMKFKSILSLYLYMYDYRYFQISSLTFIIDVDVLCCKNFSPISSPVPCSANSPCSPGRLQTRHPVRWTVAHLPRKLLPARLKTLPSENPWEDGEMLLIPSLLPNN